MCLLTLVPFSLFPGQVKGHFLDIHRRCTEKALLGYTCQTSHSGIPTNGTKTYSTPSKIYAKSLCLMKFLTSEGIFCKDLRTE